MDYLPTAGTFDVGGVFVGQGYANPVGTTNAEKRAQIMMAMPGTITGLMAQVDTAPDPSPADGSVQQWVAILKINGAGTPIRCAISEQNVSCSDMTTTWDDRSVVAGDMVTVRVVPTLATNGPMMPAHITITIMFEPDQ